MAKVREKETIPSTTHAVVTLMRTPSSPASSVSVEAGNSWSAISAHQEGCEVRQAWEAWVTPAPLSVNSTLPHWPIPCSREFADPRCPPNECQNVGRCDNLAGFPA